MSTIQIHTFWQPSLLLYILFILMDLFTDKPKSPRFISRKQISNLKLNFIQLPIQHTLGCLYNVQISSTEVSHTELFFYIFKSSPQQVLSILQIGTPIHHFKPDTRKLFLDLTTSPLIYNPLPRLFDSAHTYSRIFSLQVLSSKSSNHLSCSILSCFIRSFSILLLTQHYRVREGGPTT